MMRVFLTASAMAMMSTSALGADMPAREPLVTEAPIAWDGFFLGVQVGAAFADLDVDYTYDLIPDGSRSFEHDDIVGGLFYGRNWQFDNWVLGIDSSISWIGIEESGGTGLGVTDADIEANFLGLSRLKAGYAFDNILIFAAGGLATTIFDVEATNGIGPDDDDTFAFGWTAGAGLETKFNDNWSARVEYIYAHIEDDVDLELGGVGNPATIDMELQMHIVRGGVAYHF